LVIAEVGLRIAGIGYGNSPVEASRRLHHERPRNYEFIAYDPAGEYGGFTVRYDDGGHRVPDEAPKAAAGGRRIAFLGDSFTEGYTSAWNDTFIGQLGGANPDIVTRNYGVASYASLMYLIQAKQDLLDFKPTDVVLQLFANDFDDDHMYLSHASSRDIDKVEWINGGPRNLAIIAMRWSYLARLLRRGQVMLSYMMSAPPAEVADETRTGSDHTLTLSIVAATRREVERQGARFYLMIVPDKGLVERNRCCADDALSREVAAFAARYGITYIDLAAAFGGAPDQAGLYYRRDIHFSAAGNRLVADTLAKAMGLRAPDHGIVTRAPP
jgi:lysophospholipase L1-like esterase